MLEDLLKISLKSIENKGIRSWLTVIGIVIGITAIVSLISLGEGLQDAINQQFSILGPNLVFVVPGGGSSGDASSSLSDHDIQVIKGVKGVDLVGGMTVRVSKIKFRDEIAYARSAA